MHRATFDEGSGSAAGRLNVLSEHHTGSITATDVAGILEEIRVEVLRNPNGARTAALRLVGLLTRRAAAKSAGTRGGLASWQKRKVDCYLAEHLEHPLQVKQLAQQVSLSVSHFCRAFKETFGTPPYMHITRLRLERAKHLMLATQDTLSEIALRCGLADQAHLSKLFRRWMGETPNAWRRRNMMDAQGNLGLRRSIGSRATSLRLAA